MHLCAALGATHNALLQQSQMAVGLNVVGSGRKCFADPTCQMMGTLVT